jgi:hypothetical protein
MTDAFDPLGRIAEHAAHPYDHPAVSEKTMERYWQHFYHHEVIALPLGDLAAEHQRAVGAVAECEAALEAAKRKPTRGYLAGTWEREQEYRQNAIEVATLQHRLIRLSGRRDALAQELHRREKAAAAERRQG